MKLKTLTVKNFRCYQDEICIEFNDSLTMLIGKNDIGKSSIMEALEIFFNNDIVSIDSGDSNVNSKDKKIEISCEFTDLPESLTLDAEAKTSLKDEYLLTRNGTLKIKKVFDCSNKKPSVEIFIVAEHPSAPGFDNLLELKEKDLQTKVNALNLDCPRKGNPVMRQAIWKSAGDLQCKEKEIPVSKAKEDTKKIWEQLEGYLPIFALFQSDRNSRDSDDEVQNPMKVAVAAALAEVQKDIENIQNRVKEEAIRIAKETHDALRTIDPGLAKELSPDFLPPTPAKWQGLFSIGLHTDEGIPLNKRGSGIRRLILVSFFKAEAERRLKTSNHRNIIYAIEEPETAQHPKNQQILLESFKLLASEPGCQIVLTTHSPGFAANLPADSIRYICRDDNTKKPIIHSEVDVFGKEVAETLGVVPDSRVQVLLFVEGPTDVAAIKSLSKALHASDSSLPDLENDPRIAFIITGGSTLQHWINKRYLNGLRKKEVHIYDRDVKKYGDQVQKVNNRDDGSWAVLTKKHEIESYLHPAAIKEAFGISIEVKDDPKIGEETPKIFSEKYSTHQNQSGSSGFEKIKESTAKKLLSKAFSKMTAEMIDERDGAGEVRSWMKRIGDMLE